MEDYDIIEDINMITVMVSGGGGDTRGMESLGSKIGDGVGDDIGLGI